MSSFWARLDPRFGRRFYELLKQASAEGIDVRVTSGYRSRAHQSRLYNRWKAGKSRLPAARPGTSKHERGLAADLLASDLPRVVKIARSLGLKWAGEKDPVHFELL